jgi:SAM-dependent methyltransferase
VPRRYWPSLWRAYCAVRPLLLAVRGIWYGGSRVMCPCCGGSFRRFLPYGVMAPYEPGPTVRPEALCPGCDALERHRLLWLYLDHHSDLLSTGVSVLHFAPEYRLAKNLRSLRNLEYLSADLGSPLAEEHFDITGIPYPNDRFDLVICSNVLEHIEDDTAAMEEMYRVLKPGGRAIVQVPLDVRREVTFEDPSVVLPQERKRLFHQDDHVRIYGRDFEARLAATGFRVRPEHYLESFDAQAVKRFGLGGLTGHGQDIYLCTKGQGAG